MEVLGIDIGGSGVKAAPVNTATGELLAERYRARTPVPATPDALAALVRSLAERFEWYGPVGCGFPGIIRAGTVRFASNVARGWVGQQPETVLSAASGLRVFALNDATAAGLAEVRLGAGRDVPGLVIVITLGSGVGSGMFVGGKVVPHTALGQLEIDGKKVARWASNKVREEERLSWKEWSKRLRKFLQKLERVFSPELFIIGGGVSADDAEFLPLIKLDTPVVPAQFRNQAGIIGAAIYAEERLAAEG
ncbi:MAG: ROK family protein [Dehalococcoidia bacterium]